MRVVIHFAVAAPTDWLAVLIILLLTCLNLADGLKFCDRARYATGADRLEWAPKCGVENYEREKCAFVRDGKWRKTERWRVESLACLHGFFADIVIIEEIGSVLDEPSGLHCCFLNFIQECSFL